LLALLAIIYSTPNVKIHYKENYMSDSEIILGNDDFRVTKSSVPPVNVDLSLEHCQSLELYLIL